MQSLLVVVRSLREESMLFSHQKDVVLKLKDFFSPLGIICRDFETDFQNDLLDVVFAPWNPRNKIVSSLMLVFRSIPKIIKFKGGSILFLQDDFSTFLLSPICRLFGLRVTLWYAHGHTSRYVKLSKPFVNNFMTANIESLSIDSRSVYRIGHMVNTSLFPISPTIKSGAELNSFFHLGRCDSSKRIPMILDVVSRFHSIGLSSKLTLIGEPTSVLDKDLLERVLEFTKLKYPDLEIARLGKVKRDYLFRELHKLGIFIHAFEGSLDKALLESTLSLNPVATLNAGYLREFGSWSGSNTKNGREFLIREIESIVALPQTSLAEELIRRRTYVMKNHSLESWLARAFPILSKRS